MNVGDSLIHSLDLLREHERAIGRLYAAFARRLPAEREFWLDLSREEEQHAHWIESLLPRVEEDSSSLVVDRFPTAAIEHSLAYIGRLIENGDSPNLTRVKAISIALDLERALLENKYFEVFTSDNPQIKRTLQQLQYCTQTHLQKVQHLWEGCTISSHTERPEYS